MTDSEAKPDLNVEKKLMDDDSEEKKSLEVDNIACPSSTDGNISKPEVTDVEPPSELDQKIIKQIEVNNIHVVYTFQVVSGATADSGY